MLISAGVLAVGSYFRKSLSILDIRLSLTFDGLKSEIIVGRRVIVGDFQVSEVQKLGLKRQGVYATDFPWP